jgi:hypothetical protein
MIYLIKLKKQYLYPMRQIVLSSVVVVLLLQWLKMVWWSVVSVNPWFDLCFTAPLQTCHQLQAAPLTPIRALYIHSKGCLPVCLVISCCQPIPLINLSCWDNLANNPSFSALKDSPSCHQASISPTTEKAQTYQSSEPIYDSKRS